jgi:hypothetical protein
VIARLDAHELELTAEHTRLPRDHEVHVLRLCVLAHDLGPPGHLARHEVVLEPSAQRGVETRHTTSEHVGRVHHVRS